MNKFDLGGLSDSCGSPQNLRLLAGYRLPTGKHGGYFNTVLNKSQAFFAVLSGDYVVVKFVRTYSMYYSTPPCGSRQTPTYGMNCTNPKLRAKMELDLVAVAAEGPFDFTQGKLLRSK